LILKPANNFSTLTLTSISKFRKLLFQVITSHHSNASTFILFPSEEQAGEIWQASSKIMSPPPPPTVSHFSHNFPARRLFH
jgi:hypothetical protein